MTIITGNKIALITDNVNDNTVKAEIRKKLKGAVDRAVQSPDYKNIYSAVIDTYTHNTVLKNFAEVRAN